MSLYYFNFTDGRAIDDMIGTELPDVRAAKAEAVNLLSAMLRSNGEHFWSDDEWRIEVQDAQHLTMFCIHVSGLDAPAIQRPVKPV
ncbi:MAG: hypothetical protein Q7J32_10915 [Sphingomonadaceae bacterium]|nr:hypothetical protein [Sphingomonadaceae bacterium]